MKKSTKIVLIVAFVIIFIVFILPLFVALIGSMIVPKLMSNVSSKACCQEIGGIISGNSCIFEDLDGNNLNIKLDKLENNNGINYCTDEYFNRNDNSVR